MPPTIITRDGQQVDPEAFAQFVAEYPKGMLGLELSEGLTDCVAAAQLYGKTSTLTLTVQIAPTKSLLGRMTGTIPPPEIPTAMTAPGPGPRARADG